MYIDRANWDEFLKPSFTRFVDGLICDIKLVINERVTMATLTGDCLHHCAALVSEESLQKYDLSDLDGKGIFTFLSLPLAFFSFILLILTFLISFLDQDALDDIFWKREVASSS